MKKEDKIYERQTTVIIWVVLIIIYVLTALAIIFIR